MNERPNTTASRILVVDDDREHAATLTRLLARESLDTTAVHDVTAALDALRRDTFDLILTDLVMPGRTGLELLGAAQHLQIDVPVILMTAFGTVERAVEAMHAGAADFIVKPIKRATLLRAIDRVLETSKLRRENAALRAELDTLKGRSRLVGGSPVFLRALSTVRQAADSEATVLLLGESGTGKELFAHEVHRRSRRAGKPFLAIQCAALPESIIESEIFGHEAGAFTGATGRKAGLFEAAGGGTVFLDEIGELTPATQVKLLRVLQEREVQRVGGTHTIPVDVRIVAATHRDLEAMVKRGTFREDLFYRLDVIRIPIPSLRERTGDVELLAAHFLEHYAHANDRQVQGFTPEARRALTAHAWPGNVRELENAVERAVVLDSDGWVGLDDLPGVIAGAQDAPASISIPVGTTLAEAERQLIVSTLAHTGGDKALTASLLGVGRRTIYRKLDEYAGGSD
jgi:two-component system response regulator HydG